jgi:hypothetical protein
VLSLSLALGDPGLCLGISKRKTRTSLSRRRLRYGLGHAWYEQNLSPLRYQCSFSSQFMKMQSQVGKNDDNKEMTLRKAMNTNAPGSACI